MSAPWMEGTALSVPPSMPCRTRTIQIDGQNSRRYAHLMDRPRRRHPVHMTPIHRHNEGIILFLTACTKGRKPILARADTVDLLRHAWDQATSWIVGRYVVMPDHVHLFCAPAVMPEEPVGQWVRFWKASASRRWPRRQEQPVWQLDFWDTQLRSVSHYDEKWAYVVENPVRAGLVEEAKDWPWQGECHELRL